MDLYNDSHEKVCILSGIKETCITSTLKTGDKEITFEFRKTNRYATDIKEEGYIRTDTDEFVIKQVEPQGFETVEKTVDECLTEAIDGTGWKVIRCDVSKKRTIRIEQNCSAWLLYAVTKAEKELGGGTGQIKLRYVYDMFVARFTWLARVISFEAFSMMVDEALERMKKMLESNKAMQTLVSGEAGETVEKDM